MIFDLVFKGGRLITAEGSRGEDLGVKDGRIAAVAPGLDGRDVVDISGCYLIPGAVDPHVHLDMPAGSTRSSDTWETGTIAAACGGTTTVIDFVEPGESQDLLEALQQRRGAAEREAKVDFSLHMTITDDRPDTLEQIPAVVRAGVPSFKLYTTYEGFKLNDGEMLRVMDAVKKAGGMVLVHCENDAMVAFAEDRTIAAGILEPEGHPLSRPASAESEAVERVLSLAELIGVEAYIVHLSTAGGAAALKRAQERGVPARGETCPQYLVLDEERYRLPDFEGAKYVCAPPLRTKRDQRALWAGLEDGIIHSVGTDHCPFYFEGQKDLGKDDFRKIPGGLPGVQSRLALMYTRGVVQGRLSLERWVALCSTTPAKLFGLYPRKGSLQPGADADLVVFDPALQGEVRHEELQEQVDYTPYQGMPLAGNIRSVYRCGSQLVDQGFWLANPSQGEFIPRTRDGRDHADHS